MPLKISRPRSTSTKTSAARICVMFFCAAFAAVLASTPFSGVNAQQTTPTPPPDNQSTAQAPAAQPPAADQPPQPTPAPTPAPESQPAQAPQPDQSLPASPTPPAATSPAPPAETAPAAPPSTPFASSAPSHIPEPAEITEDEIRHLLTGKQLFLRGGYLDNDLSYNEHGILVGHSPQGSYTLSAIQIDKVHLTKHKLELEGQRFGLHFLGALPYEDPTKAVDQVNITPKKKIVKITIDRELVVKPKEKKEKGKPASPAPKTATAPSPATAPAPASAAPPADATGTTDAQADAQAEIAATPAAERPADAKSVTTTISQAHANTLLRGALDNVFAEGFDTRLMDSMPDFWKLYYAAAAAKTDYRPADPAVLRQSMVDQKAHLTSTFEPASNQYAQDHGVAGMCLYHVVIGPDGKPAEIAVARPIGFGLDESAVDSIRKATFQPAIKGGKPVPVMLDLIVEFRIYSKRTAVSGNPNQQPAAPSLPGPYSAQQPPSAP
jgi:outer membrane biosynthesis protein TonB